MASTQYETNVILFSGVPFNNSYNYTLYPDYMASKREWLKSNYSYYEQDKIMLVKINTTSGFGVLRLEVPDAKAHSFNYAYIYDNKTPPYFVFINGCTYINDGRVEGSSVYEFNIQKDVLMSHLVSSSQLHEASIIRHHSTSRFNNPWCAEPFQGGKVLNQNYNRVNVETSECYAVMQYVSAESDMLINDAGRTISKTPNGCLYAFFEVYDALALHNFCVNDAKYGNNIAAIYTVPKCLFTGAPAEGGSYLQDNNVQQNASTHLINYDYKITALPNTNHKCYYYPYSFFRVYNDAGQYMDLQYELWDDYQSGMKAFAVEGTAVAPVSVTLHPVGYNKSGTNDVGDGYWGAHYNMPSTHKLTISGYPQGSWINDAYAQAIGSGRIFDFDALLAGNLDQASRSFVKYTAEHVGSMLPSLSAPTAATAEQAAASEAAGTAMAGVSALTSIAGEVIAQTAAEYQCDTIGGTPGSATSEYVHKHKYFYTSQMRLSLEDMTALNSLFDRYGYAQGGVVARPDIAGRPRYCYVRTASDVFIPSSGTGSEQGFCNTNEANIINGAFQNGITFWSQLNTAATIGDFNNADGSNGTDSIPLP